VTAPPRPVVAVPGPPPGPGLTGTPALQPLFGPAALLEHVPGVFRFDLGAFGGPEGVAVGLTPPHRVALSIGGRPVGDVFTGRPAVERLPEDIVAPIHPRSGLFGAEVGLAAYVRPYVAAVPITELRYRTGPDGLQLIGVTHAQTRRPAFVQRIGGEAARMTALVHVSGQQYRGQYVNDARSGLRVIGRLTFAFPGVGIELTQSHYRWSEGAWGGVDPAAPDPFIRAAPVRDPAAQRESIHNDLSLRLSTRLLPEAPPVSVMAYWIAATHRYVLTDTTDARGHRFGFSAEQRLRAGLHRLAATADLRLGRYSGGTAFSPDENHLPIEVHATLSDSISIGALDVVLRAGAHVGGEVAFPSFRAETSYRAGPLSARLQAFASGAVASPVERLGFGRHVEAGPLSPEQTLGAEASLAYQLGPLVFDLGVEVQRRNQPRILLIDDISDARFTTLDGSITSVLGVGGIRLRPDEPRGAYAHVWAAAVRQIDEAPTELHRRAAAALPEAFGYARLGFRAPALFDGALDVDVFARARGWTAFRGRALDPATALLGLPAVDAPEVPARAMVDAVLEAGIGGGRARAFVTYQNALAGVAYPGVFVVPVYPLPAPAVRAGLFWVLMN
jgi:hypothetical protein